MVENKQIEICEELGQNFIDFSYEANSCRAFADARDGLKPGQRACLWEMYDKGYLSNKPHVKSAKISGAVTGNWWPHGDVAIYETFARMSQPWINNIPEVDWHGNNGSQYTGPECASSRYTEARLSKSAENGLFRGIKKENVKMILNFSEDAYWPEVLPAVFPRLMVNGCQGIGSTIANVWLPHALDDVTKVILQYMETGDVDTKSIYPSFPTGGIIINKDDVHTIYETGKGKVILRGKVEIKDNKILITELPYQIYAQPYVEKITEMAIKNELTGIAAVYNKSGKNKLLIEIECEGSAESVLKQLYAKTDLQKNYNANQWALVGKTPKLLTLKDYCKIYLEHNNDFLIKEAQYDLKKAQERLEVVKGLLIALEDIDNVIALIKNSNDSTDAKTKLIAQYKLTEPQAKAILAMRLSSLAKLEKVALEKEEEELFSEIEYCNRIINAKLIRESIIRDRIESFSNAYAQTARKTELMQIDIKSEDKEIIEVVPEDCVVIATQAGNIKRVASNSFKIQKRNGKGVKNEDEAIMNMISTNTIDNLLLFTDKGRMFKILVDNIPAGNGASKGIHMSSLVNLEPNEKVMAITSMDRKNEKQYIIFITKNGLFKKTNLSEYSSMKRSTGVVAIKLKDGDSIANITFANEEDFIVITKGGMGIKFETSSIAPIGRATSGVKSIKLADNDEVLIGLPIEKKSQLATFTRTGYAKKTDLNELPIQGRAGKGLKVSSEPLAGALLIDDTDNVLLIGKPNNICISAAEIPLLARTCLGNIMIKNEVKSVVKI